MKQERKSWYQRLMAGLLVIALCFSTGLGVSQVSAAKKIRINKKKISIETGKTVRLNISGTKTNFGVNQGTDSGTKTNDDIKTSCYTGTNRKSLYLPL